jgi:uncharacterized metal-binding protein YceD (DUF177 family)
MRREIRFFWNKMVNWGNLSKIMREKKPLDESFKIYVDQLKKGGVEKLHEEYSPEFLDVHEKDLDFKDPISVEGEAYVAEGELILRLNISTAVWVLCSVCNEPVKVPFSIDGHYIAIPLEEIKSGIFSLVEPLREAVLLEAPAFAECGGACPERKSVEKYLKTHHTSKDAESMHYRPFEGLKSDEGV